MERGKYVQFRLVREFARLLQEYNSNHNCPEVYSTLSFCPNDSVIKLVMFGRIKSLASNLCREDLLPNAVAPWGSRLTGLDEGDGWLRVAT